MQTILNLQSKVLHSFGLIKIATAVYHFLVFMLLIPEQKHKIVHTICLVHMCSSFSFLLNLICDWIFVCCMLMNGLAMFPCSKKMENVKFIFAFHILLQIAKTHT